MTYIPLYTDGYGRIFCHKNHVSDNPAANPPQESKPLQNPPNDAIRETIVNLISVAQIAIDAKTAQERSDTLEFLSDLTRTVADYAFMQTLSEQTNDHTGKHGRNPE